MVEFNVKKQNFKPFGEKDIKRSQIKISIDICGVEIFSRQSGGYGLSKDEVIKESEAFLSNIRSGLTLSNVRSVVNRLEV